MNDKLSALLDGDLDEQSIRPVLDSVRRDPSVRIDWDAYCIIGDVLRGDREGSPDLVARVMTAIDEEPTLLAPPRVPERPANAGRWRALLPLAASVMGVVAVGWVAQTLYSQPGEASQLAGAVERVRVSESVPAAVRPVASAVEDPHREYVFAHQAMTAGGPIPGAVQYVRTISIVGQDGGR